MKLDYPADSLISYSIYSSTAPLGTGPNSSLTLTHLLLFHQQHFTRHHLTRHFLITKLALVPTILWPMRYFSFQFKNTHPSKHTRFSSTKLYLTCATFNLDENPVPVISYYRHFFLYYYHVRCHHCSIASSICIHHITYITKLIYLS